MFRHAVAVAYWCAAGFAQTTGAQLATYHSLVDDSEQPYALYVPPSYSPAKKWPLVITLHEEDSNHRLNLRRVFGAPVRVNAPDSENMRYFPAVPDYGFLVAAPFARGSMGYEGIAERDVYDVLADVKRRFPVDEDRVYLTGISTGGIGALRLVLTRPDVWAAVAVLCPGPAGGVEEMAGNASSVPVRLYHGDLDPIVAPETSRAWHRRLLDAGVPVSYLEYPNVRHNVWDEAYRDGAVFEWFAQHKRNADPERVKLKTRSYRYGSAYWVRVDGMTPGVLASIDASRTPGELRVSTQNVDAFTVMRPAAHVVIDGAAVTVKAGVALSFVKSPGGWRQGQYVAAGKHPGLEGPIAEAVYGRQIYVYGTLGSDADVEARRKVAETAAHWSTVRQKVAFAPRVVADTMVSAADLEEADLVVFGSAETNSVLARFGARLPLALSSAAADWGLVFVAPLGKHYVVVSSGLPWWTGTEEVRRGGDAHAPPMYRLLTTFGDYVLFKGSLGNVVAEGRFDPNWRVPAEAAAKMIVTGTVAVR